MLIFETSVSLNRGYVSLGHGARESHVSAVAQGCASRAVVAIGFVGKPLAYANETCFVCFSSRIFNDIIKFGNVVRFIVSG